MEKLTLEQIMELKRGDIVYIKRNGIPNESLQDDWSTVGFFSTIKNRTIVLKFKSYHTEHEMFDINYYDVFLLTTKVERNAL